MKERKRAIRRHHRGRLYRKRLKQERGPNCWIGAPTQEDINRREEWAVLRARKRIDTNVGCSCPMCGNPRRYYGFASHSGSKLTFGELRAVDSMNDAMEEVLTD